MNPETAYGLQTNTTDPEGNRFKKRLRLLIFILVAAVIIFVMLALVSHRKKTPPFSVTSTVPSITGITTQTPSMAVNFNEPLAAHSASVTSSPSIVTGYSIHGDTLTLTFAPKTLLSSKTYSITIQSITSTTGKKLTNQQTSIKPIYVGPVITGEKALISIGLTTTQVNDINSYVGQFSPWAQNMSIDQTSIRHYMENPSNPWSPWAVSFTMTLDGTQYTVVGDFYSTQDIQVKFSNPSTGQLLFTAGTPGSI